ncbi:MAG: 16S rRNA (adenine(1518)-N(6)/adenine(1519)-N(6))-dimethyltransferase RsmA [Mycobacteriales bacterium]
MNPTDTGDASVAASSVRLLGSSDIRALLAKLAKRPTKTLGQNFVHDPNTIRRIVAAAGVRAGDVVLEVGPGLGSLTLGLLETGATVVAVEIDPVLAAELPATVARYAPDRADRLTVVVADAMRPLSLPPQVCEPVAVVANLPYNVAVPVLLTLWEALGSLRSGLVMVQAEVAQRIAAGPGSRIYGAPSVKLAWYAAATRAGSVPRSVFWPMPNVDSELVRMTRQEPPLLAGATPSRQEVFAVIDAAFAQRRKMLRSALAPMLGSSGRAETVLRVAGVEPTARGETLGLVDYVRIAAAVEL